MSIQHTAKARRGAAALALAASLALAVAACGGSDDSGKESSEQSSTGKKSDGDKDQEESNTPEPTETLAEAQGEDGMALTINSVQRDAGGFVTVNGSVKNTGDKGYFKTPEWRGNEKELVTNGYSLGGAALVDQEGKKRYYVLRDTEGRCLCTTGITKVDANESIPFFVQFPSPPDETTEVEFSLPTFQAATVEISE